MPPQGRPRTAREESPHRKPFSAASSPRSKYSFPVVNTPVLRRSRHNSENQPPESAFNVKANSPFSEANVSPALHPSKSTSAKGKHHGSLSLPPRPPPPRPSPSTNPVKTGHDAQGNVKRKLNLEPPACADTSVRCHAPHEQDNGVKVIIRLRPCNQKEESEEATQIVERISNDSLSLADQNFTFDYVAGQDSSQQSMFEMVGQPLVENCLQGFNSSIFAYGQTGSGKTYTMWGATQDLMAQPPCEERGLTPRVFECLFQRIEEEEKKNADKQLRYQCRCSFFEIYNEQITDLLDPLQKALQVREDIKTGVYVENLTEEFVSSVSDVFHLMSKGLGNRKIASTSMNMESSRSHTLFTCMMESRCKSMSDGVSSVRTSRMNLVDLAGSERQKLTGAAGDRLKEAGNINRSLSQLGNLINILAEVSQSGKPRHIPYRDSRLTFLLQESLGGNAKLAMICAISPASSCKSETLSTLRFAQRAKSIQNKAVVNEETEDDVKILREQIRQLKDELMRMKSNETIPGAAGSYSTSWNARRSYNLLRMSLSRPMTLPHTDTDTDEEMEIDEDAVECATPTTKPDDSGKTYLKAIASAEKELENGQHDSVTKLLPNSSVEGDEVLISSEKSSTEDAWNVCCPTELVGYCAERTEGLHGDIKSDDLPAQGSSFQRQSHPEAEEVNMELSDLDNNTVNIDQSSCLEKLLGPTLQESIDPLLQVQDNMSALEEAHMNMRFSSILKTEYETCETSEKIAFEEIIQEVSLSNGSQLYTFIQAENGDAYGLAESPSQDCTGVEPDCKITEGTSVDKGSEVDASPLQERTGVEPDCKIAEGISVDKGSAVAAPPLQECTSVELDCKTAECTSGDKGAEAVSNFLAEDKCATSFQMEPSIASKADKNIVDAAPAGVINKLSLSDDFDSVRMSAELNDAHPKAHYLESLADLNQLQQVRVDAEHSWVATDASQPNFEAGGHEWDEEFVNGTDGRNEKTPAVEPVLKSPVLCISPHLAVDALEAPILSISPRLVDDRSKRFGTSASRVLVQKSSMGTCAESYTDFEDAQADAWSQESEDTAIKASLVTPNMRSSQNLSSPTDRLAASLHRGLQILENHQKKVANTRTSVVRFSFQNSEWDIPKTKSTVNKSVQTSPVCLPGTAPEHSEDEEIKGLPIEQECEKNHLDHASMDEPNTPRRSDLQVNQNMEAILAGALRRERAMEEDLNRKSAEIEQLNRLVRQYKHERECNAVLQQSSEDKIARLESLMDGTLPTDSFLNEEWSSLLNEHKILQQRYDHHPEVTLANIRQQRLCEDIEKYKSFCELGERDALLREVSQLRNQLQYYVELDTPRSKQRQRSLTPQAKFSAADEDSAGESTVFDKAESQTEDPNPTSDSVGCHVCEKEAAQWMERENEWMSVLEELRVELDEYKQLAEQRKHEMGGQQRCANEMKEALQMAMQGHARLLDQYAELQEKHIGLLAKHRKFRDAMSTARKKAGKMGFLGGGKWFQAQAAELIAVKLEQEQERKAAKEQIDGLQAQLRDTADAVQAAGELLVRLKEAEETVLIAQDAAALAEQDAERLYREIDKLKRRHSTEIATFQQRLLEARFQKSTICPMCVMAERVKFEFTGVDGEEAEAAFEAQHLAAEEAKEQQAATPSHVSLQMRRGELAEEPSYDENEEFYMQGLDDFHTSEMDEK